MFCFHSKGALEVVPSILYLTTGVIKEIALKSNDDPTIIANSGIIQTALHCLRSIATDKYSNDERCVAQLKKLLQSALGFFIDLSKTGCDETKTDEVTMMLGIALFILHAPDIVNVPNLKFPSINHFQQCLQNESNLMVKFKCIQTVRSIFMNADLKVATPYIHALAPRIFEGLYSINSKNPKTELELNIVLESITTVDALIDLAEPQNSKSFLVTFYIIFLFSAMITLFLLFNKKYYTIHVDLLICFFVLPDKFVIQ